MHKIYLLSLGLVTLSLPIAVAQKPLSLKEAITLSLQNSKLLKASQAKVEEAEAAWKTAAIRQLPDLSVSGAYLRMSNPSIDLKLKSGGENKNAAPEANSAAYGIVNASLPVFSGRMIQSGKEASHYLAIAAKLDADKDKADVIQNTIVVYSNLYKAHEALTLVRENIKSSRERVKEFADKEKNGLLARNDLLKAELQLSTYQLALMDAENNLKISNLTMDILLGLPDSSRLEVDSTAFALNHAESRTAVEFEQLAYQNRKEAAALSAREKAAHANVKGAGGEYFPSLALTGGYIAAYIPNVITISNAFNAGIGLKYNISSLWKAGSKVAEARARLTEIQANEARIADNIHLEVYQSYENYLLSQRKLETHKKAIEQAAENYRITKNKHDNNLTATTNLLDADVANLQSRLNYAYAKADVLVAYSKLLQSAGILEQNNK